jgi:DNA-binding CsgD family transcriptional regulator
MPRSHAETSKRAVARIQRLCCLGVDCEMLMPDLMEEITAFVPARGGAFDWLERNAQWRDHREVSEGDPAIGPVGKARSWSHAAGAELTHHYQNLWPPSIERLHFREFRGTPRLTGLFHPFNKISAFPASSAVVPFAQHLRGDRRKYRGTDYYNAIWRPAGIDDVLILGVRPPGQKLGVLRIFRAAEEVPFGPDDVARLKAIAGFVAHSMTRATLEDDAFVDGGDHALCVVGHDGVVQHADPQARRLLRMALHPRLTSRSSEWSDLPEAKPELVELCRRLASIAQGRIYQKPPALCRRTEWGEFVLRAYWLGPTDGAEQTRQIGITIERQVPRALALRRRVENLPLTGREKQICVLMARDRSRQDLADAIGVSTGTIITHQTNIYAKLGVHSRAELLAALLTTP